MVRALAIVCVLLALPEAARAGEPRTLLMRANCLPDTEMLALLKTKHGEEPVIAADGPEGLGSRLAVTVSPRGTYSVLVTGMGGYSCLVAAGRNWPGAKPGLGI